MKKKKMLFFILILLSSCIWLVGNMMMHDGALKTVYVPAKVPSTPSPNEYIQEVVEIHESTPKPIPEPTTKPTPKPKPTTDPIPTSPIKPTPLPPEPTATPKPENSYLPLLVERISQVGQSSQVIIVTTSSSTSFKATIQVYEKINGVWQHAFKDIQGVVGRNGVDKKKEGDGKSPTGIYSFGTAFGTVSRPTGIKMPYTVSTEHDYWIDDVNSLDYNKWVNYEGDPKERWASFERLKITPYKYSLVINYNTYDIVPGKGSAIFMHIGSSSSKGTAGCINISEINMLKILKWLDPSKDPILIQGTKVYVESLAK